MKQKIYLAIFVITLGVCIVLVQQVLSIQGRDNLISDRKLMQVRPIAEFEPSFAIALSEQILLKESGPELLKEIIGANAKVYLLQTQLLQDEVNQKLADMPSLSRDDRDKITKLQLEHDSFWLRDFLPLPIYKTFPFLPPTPSFVDFVYRDGNSFDDAAMHQFALSINTSIEHVPIVLDGGNFMSDGKDCILSDDLSSDPDNPQTPKKAVDLRPQMSTILKAAMGCQQTFLVSQVPHPHVDMWLKFVSKGTLLVNEIQDRTLATLGELEPAEKDQIVKIKEALDTTATRLAQHFRVIRVPMPAPVHDIFFTYLNSVIVNEKVIIPRYQDPDPHKGPYPDRSLYSSYERDVANAYKNVGLKPVFLRSDELIAEGGAFHCITFQLPDLDAIERRPGPLAIRFP